MLSTPKKNALLSLSLFGFSACHESKTSKPIDVPVYNTKVMDVQIADTATAETYIIGRATATSSSHTLNGKYVHDVSFKVTNRLDEIRCFVTMTLTYAEDKAKTSFTYISGALKKDAFGTSTDTCIDPHGTAYATFLFLDEAPQLNELKLVASDNTFSAADWVDDTSLRIVGKKLENSRIVATLKNESLADGLQIESTSKWFVTANDQVVQWGFLSPPENFGEHLLGLGEIVELSGKWDTLKGAPPQQFDLLIFP